MLKIIMVTNNTKFVQELLSLRKDKEKEKEMRELKNVIKEDEMEKLAMYKLGEIDSLVSSLNGTTYKNYELGERQVQMI